MSPTIFREGPYRFFFFSREESRMHVHVASSEGEAKFWLEPKLELCENYCCRSEKSRRLLKSSREGSMKSGQRGAATSRVEVTNISPHGFWLLLGGKELFVSFTEFPWFKDATVSKIARVEWPSSDHLYWPELDIDLSVRSIEHPEEFPLKFAPSNSA